MTLDNAEEKRHFHRIIYNADATLTDGRNDRHCNIVDLSLKGCLLRFDQPWSAPIEKIYTMTLQLSDTITIQMELSVSHIIGHQVGFKCEHIDIDSISQLRRLVELNLGDSSLLERDLLALSERQGSSG